MVRGIYQTSDAGHRSGLVTFGLTVAFLLILVGGVCWAIQTAGDIPCSMPGYWNYQSETYTTHAKRALDEAGYSYDTAPFAILEFFSLCGVRDMGDWPKGAYCGLSSIKTRRFVVTNLRAPDDSRTPKAEVFVKFDGGTLCVPQTTVQSYKPL